MKKTIALFVLLFSCYLLKAQISGIELEMRTVPNNDPYAERDNAGIPLPLHVATVTVNLISFSAIEKIHVNLGSSTGSHDIFSKTFSLAEPTVSEEGSSMALDANHIYLVLGTFSYSGVYHAELKAEMSDGSFSEVYGDSGP